LGLDIVFGVVLESEVEYSKLVILRLSEQKSTKINRLIDQSISRSINNVKAAQYDSNDQ